MKLTDLMNIPITRMRRARRWVADAVVKRSALYADLRGREALARYGRDELRKTNDMLAERVDEVARKMCAVTVQFSPRAYRRYRICIDIDGEYIERGLMHGNDSLIIDYIGRDIGRRAADEIRRANFQRWEV